MLTRGEVTRRDAESVRGESERAVGGAAGGVQAGNRAAAGHGAGTDATAAPPGGAPPPTVTAAAAGRSGSAGKTGSGNPGGGSAFTENQIQDYMYASPQISIESASDFNKLEKRIRTVRC